MVWTGFWAFILWGLLHSRVGPCLIVGFSLFSPPFAPSVNLLAFLPCHSVIPAMVLFDPCLLGLFWAYCMLFFHLITVTQHCHWVYLHATWTSLTHSIAYGLPQPISSSLGILDPFSFLGHPQSIPILHSHGLLLTLLGLHGPITISFTLGVHGLSFNSLLTYFITSSLLWLILTFLLPMGLLLLYLGSFRPTCFFRGPFVILWAYDPSFLPFGLNGFSLNLLSLFYPYCWASSCYWAFPKWASPFSPLSIWSAPAVHMWTKDFLLLPVFPFFFLFFPFVGFFEQWAPPYYYYFSSCHEQCCLFEFPSLAVILKYSFRFINSMPYPIGNSSHPFVSTLITLVLKRDSLHIPDINTFSLSPSSSYLLSQTLSPTYSDQFFHYDAGKRPRFFLS